MTPAGHGAGALGPLDAVEGSRIEGGAGLEAAASGDDGPVASSLPNVMWLAYALATVVLWAAWSFLAAIALKGVTPAHATLAFGIAVVVVGAASLVLGDRDGSLSPSGLTIAAVSGACGALGMATFYLALDHGKASSVVPIIGVYPAFVALLAVAFLSESLSAVQAVGVALAVTGVILVGTGG